MRPFLSLAVTAILATPLAAQPPKTDAKAIAATIAPFVDEQTLAAVHIAPDRIDPAELARLVLPSRSEQEQREFQNEIARWKESCAKLGAKEMFVLFSLADWNEPIAYVLPLTAGNSDPKAIRELLDPFVGKASLESTLQGKTFIAGSKLMVNHLKSIKAVARPELAAALEAAGDSDIQAVVIPTSDQRKVILELLPLASKWKGSDVLKPWIGGAKWAAVGASLTPKLTLQARVQAENNESAKSLADRVPDLLKLIGQELIEKSQDPFAGKLKVEVAESQPGAEAAAPDVAKALSAFVTTTIEVTLQKRHANDLTKIAEAMYRHFEANSGLYPGWAYYGPLKIDTNDSRSSFPQSPFTIPNKGAKPLLSWRVMILPYLGYKDLFRQFRLNEPWDSDHNKKLIAKMPSEYRSRNSKLNEAWKTQILVPVGPRTIFPPNGEPVTPRDISDGLANTILLVEAADDSAVIWTKPGDWRFDPSAADLTKGLLNPGANGFVAVWADGEVGTVPKNMKPAAMQLLFIRNTDNVKDIPDRRRGFPR